MRNCGMRAIDNTDCRVAATASAAAAAANGSGRAAPITTRWARANSHVIIARKIARNANVRAFNRPARNRGRSTRVPRHCRRWRRKTRHATDAIGALATLADSSPTTPPTLALHPPTLAPLDSFRRSVVRCSVRPQPRRRPEKCARALPLESSA